MSTDDQDLSLQRVALREAGWRRVFEEKVSGARRHRPELARLPGQVREDDRPKLDADQVALAHRLVAEGTSVRAAARMLNVHAATLYRGLAALPLGAPPDPDNGGLPFQHLGGAGTNSAAGQDR